MKMKLQKSLVIEVIKFLSPMIRKFEILSPQKYRKYQEN